jgi:carbamoyl-phosphate synthase large subunit
MDSKKVFVSGGAGVIGLEMIPKLLARGAIVMVGDLKPRPASFPAEVTFRQGDLNNMSYGEMRQFEPDVFIHLAATFERSSESYSFWEENFWHNVRLSHHMMSLAKDQPTLKRVVFASSYLIYQPELYQFSSPHREVCALRETDPIAPRNLTGMAKFAHEMELRFIEQYRATQFSTVCARIFRGYGRNSRDVISRWIRALIDEEVITVYRPEGKFDYIYAADSAEGLIRLAESPKVTGVVNLGTGRARQVQEVVDILRSNFPDMKSVDVQSDIPYEASQANITKLQELLCWSPEYDLEQAIPEMIAFERSRKNRCKVNGVIVAPVVLISSASHKIPLLLAMREAAHRIHDDARVIAGDVSQGVISAYVADGFWIMPSTCDEALESILEGCRVRGINTILPTRDGELLFWARHANRFMEEGIKIIISSEESLIRCIDKKEFSDFGISRNLPTIPSVNKPEEYNAKRFVVKERYGAGSRAIGIDLNYDQAKTHARQLQNPIFQPYVDGKEFSVDAWVDRSHQVKGLVMRYRDKVINGESAITTTFTNTALEIRVREIIELLKLRGPVVLQAILDANGALHVIECNARFGGASTAGIAAGLDSFFWSLAEAQSLDLNGYQFVRAKNEIRQVRVPTDIYIHDPDI